MMGGIGSAFSRLSMREKIMVSTMLALLVGVVVIIANLWIGASVSMLRTEVRKDRKSLQTIYARAGAYERTRRHAEQIEALAARSRNINLKLAINEVAKQVTFQAKDVHGNPEGLKKVSDIMQFDQTQETYLSKKKRGSGAKNNKEAGVGYYRRDQPVTLSDALPFTALYQLLNKIETSDQLLFVTDIELTRNFRDGYTASKNARIVVSTFYYKGAHHHGAAAQGARP